jgi:LacI family transcriptional regulator
MAARLKDVAERVGVSIKTVSNVINGHQARVSPATRARVEAAIEELGYRPHAAAQGLRTRQSHLIGLISDQVAFTPYAVGILKGAHECAHARGKILMILNTDGDPTAAEAAAETLLARRVEGIIYASMYHKAVHPPDSIKEVPAVLLNCYCAERSLPSVVPDEVRGGREATEALLRQGHRRIGLLNVGRFIPAAVGRLAGYKQALAAYDVPFDPALVRSGNSMADSGYRGALELMHLADPPTALFCGTDRMAMGAYDALKEVGAAVPGDVAVRGFDDQEMIAPYLHPPLSTSVLPHYEMGQWAVSYLLHEAEKNPDAPPIQHMMHCPLVDRAST